MLTSYSLGFFRNQWNRAIIHPISMAGSKNYRPICLLSKIDKITERFVTWTLEQGISLRPNHFGCRAGTSSAYEKVQDKLCLIEQCA